MPITAVSTTPVKKVLDESDSSGQSWVSILPASQRHEEMRGEHLKSRAFAYDDVKGLVSKVNVNLYSLHVEELWILYGGAHIEIVETLKDGKQTTSQPFKAPGQLTYAEFHTAIGKLPRRVIDEWHARLVEVNPDWQFPF